MFISYLSTNIFAVCFTPLCDDTACRVPTAPGKPGQMTTVFPVLEKYWNFIILLKILEKWE